MAKASVWPASSIETGDESNWAAIQAIGKIGSDAAVDSLLELMDAGSEDTAYAVIAALGDVGSARAIEALVAILSECAEPRFRQDVGDWAEPRFWQHLVIQLVEQGPASVPPLVDALEDGSIPESGLYWALSALSQIADNRDLEWVVRQG